jgi:hypothetical protein
LGQSVRPRPEIADAAAEDDGHAITARIYPRETEAKGRGCCSKRKKIPLEITNVSESTLDGAIDYSVTAIDVADAFSFPTDGDFRINIKDELVKVTGVLRFHHKK